MYIGFRNTDLEWGFAVESVTLYCLGATAALAGLPLKYDVFINWSWGQQMLQMCKWALYSVPWCNRSETFSAKKLLLKWDLFTCVADQRWFESALEEVVTNNFCTGSEEWQEVVSTALDDDDDAASPVNVMVSSTLIITDKVSWELVTWALLWIESLTLLYVVGYGHCEMCGFEQKKDN